MLQHIHICVGFWDQNATIYTHFGGFFGSKCCHIYTFLEFNFFRKNEKKKNNTSVMTLLPLFHKFLKEILAKTSGWKKSKLLGCCVFFLCGSKLITRRKHHFEIRKIISLALGLCLFEMLVQYVFLLKFK